MDSTTVLTTACMGFVGLTFFLVTCYTDWLVQIVASGIRRVLVSVFSDKLVQDTLMGPLDKSMSKNFVAHMPSAIAAMNRCPDVQTSLPNLILSRQMTEGLNATIACLLHRQDFQEGFVACALAVTDNDAVRKTIAHSILDALSDPATKATVRDLLIQGLQDQELQKGLTRGVLSAVTEGMKAAANDAELKGILKDTVIESLRDEDLHEATMQGCLRAVKHGVKEALRDEELRDLFKNVLKDSLQDQEIHKATMKGAMDAIFPWGKTPRGCRPVEEKATGSETGRSSP